MGTICYIAASSEVYGGNQSLLALLKGLNKRKYNLLVLLPSRGPLLKELKELGVDYKIWRLHEKNKLKRYTKDMVRDLSS